MSPESPSKKITKGGSFKTSVLKEQPLKNACFAACEPEVRRRETARASAKLTEFCKRLKGNLKQAAAQNYRRGYRPPMHGESEGNSLAKKPKVF
jgi:hypothetical protein